MPAAAYLPYMQTGNLVFLSGHIAKQTASPGSASWART
jgi:enamine deaminase RidA (YjgF/YER057c/UK114 family)